MPRNPKKETYRDYSIELALETGAMLKMLLFSHEDHRWIQSYRYIKEDGPEPFVNNITAVLGYTNGRPDNQLSVTMDMIFPERRGKVYWVGVDVSPNSRMFVEFEYESDGQSPLTYVMTKVRIGATKQWDVKAGETLPMKQVDFPYPIADRLESTYGQIEVPFRTNDDVDEMFAFPISIVKTEIKVEESVDG